MKKLVILFLGLAGLTACGRHDGYTQKTEALNLRIYNQSIRFGDLGTAIQAMHTLLAIDSTKTQYYDSLAMLYFDGRNFPQAVQSARMVLRKDSTNDKMMEVIARSYQGMERGRLSIPYFMKLSAMTKNPAFDYHVAMEMFKAGELAQSESYAQQVISSPKADSMDITILAYGREQAVPLKAGAYNILGSVKLAQQKKAEAKDMFHKALELDSSFYLARTNLMNVDHINPKK